MPVIGFLGIATPAPFAPFVAAFHQGLRETGYAEGRNVAVEYRWAEGNADRLPELAADLAARKVDVIATIGGSLAVHEARRATSSIPIVFEIGMDPVEAGLAASMSRPGGNLTGVTIMTADLNPKRLELLSEMASQARVIALLVNSQHAGAERTISEVRMAADARGLRIKVVTATSEDEYEPAFAQARAEAGRFCWPMIRSFSAGASAWCHWRRAIRLPAMYEWREFVELGGLMSYGTSFAGMIREQGRYVGRVLAGTPPADLPILQPTTFEFVINLRTALALGLAVPQSLLARADEVIE